MNVLLDTHVLIWSLTNDTTLSDNARHQIVDGANLVFVSAISVWEISIKMQLGKLSAPGNLLEEIMDKRFDLLDVKAEHSWRAGQLPPIHQDPFDRMLVAQAQVEQLTLLTRDTRIHRYDVATLIA